MPSSEPSVLHNINSAKAKRREGPRCVEGLTIE